ncbi:MULTISPECIES: hypothetical protein [unclassified Streptomyces]|uniref:hypothetical protein n=1 Tax=unclassified Streptomyces TaxID=2593676 RepID=UPI00136E2B90|nr:MULTISPECIES: hypothetical protein [unclassified Streptomyces]NDZ98519.1 hypothetical protein [Streptomyces sp. SID10116]MYY79754.1 hypothetical protein [Streptomyces sp. SID335]MYZ16542.1 hypothetical protein [Streptomyces sp. SID337]NDZ84509.1 hypothetical protein [Streptomyces sp. SID10115]NEB43472.1 hypothetical protein [Streptomyces sp. SID339]
MVRLPVIPDHPTPAELAAVRTHDAADTEACIAWYAAATGIPEEEIREAYQRLGEQHVPAAEG